jgi:hypothetical protein
MAATTTNKQLTQYSGDTPSALFIRDVPDWTKMLRRTDTPYLKLIGRGSAPSTPMLKKEWGWSSPDPVKDVMNDSGGIDGSVTTMTVTNGTYFAVGDIIRVESENMRVTAISTNDLTVVRGVGGTSAAVHADALPVYILGPGIVEGADDPLSPITQGEVDFNYHQIMSFTWNLTNRRKITPTYETRGLGSTADKIELRKKMQHTAPGRLERTLLFGGQAIGTAAATPSLMGGILTTASYVTTTNDLGSGTVPLTEYDLMNTLQTAYNLVGGDMLGKTLLTSMFTKRVISSWYNPNRRYEGSDNTANVVFTEIDSEFGRLKVVPSYVLDEMYPGIILAFNPSDIELTPYASSTGWQTGELATQGWYTKGFLRGDYTQKCENPDSRVIIKDFSVTASDYPAIA